MRSPGYAVLRKGTVFLRLDDLRLVPERRWRGIEAELVTRAGVWAKEQDLELRGPPRRAFPEATRVRERIEAVLHASATDGEPIAVVAPIDRPG